MMKNVFSALTALLALSILAVSCDDGKKKDVDTEPVTDDIVTDDPIVTDDTTDDILTDEDAVTDDLLPDGDEPAADDPTTDDIPSDEDDLITDDLIPDEDTAPQIVIYVDTNATGANSGLSWADAFTDLSAAIAEAGAGQELWVAAGTYLPTTCPAFGNCTDRKRHFDLKKGVALYGGFAGSESERDERDPAVNETILSVDFDSDDSWDSVNEAWSNREENGLHVLYVINETELDETTILDGFTVTGGHADTAPYDEGGGGLRLGSENSPVIRNCIFRDNFGVQSGGAIGMGGASLRIENTLFTGNFSKNGGAIHAKESTLEIVDCRFEGNYSAASGDEEHRGGAIALEGEGEAYIVGADFTGNRSLSGGAINNGGATLTIEDSLFIENVGTALKNGEALLTVRDSEFRGNTAVNAAAIEVEGGSAVLSGTRFIDNHATMAGDGFAGLGGAISFNNMDGAPDLSATIVNCVFEGNTAALWGGAILFLMYGDVTVTNCSFSNNADSGDDAIVFVESDTVFINTIVWDKVSALVGEIGPFDFGPSVPSFSYSDLRDSGGSAAWVHPFAVDGGNNIDADPLFVGAGADLLLLESGSPCIDAGDNDAVPVDLLTDILGNDRIQGGTVDMGAYEY